MKGSMILIYRIKLKWKNELEIKFKNFFNGFFPWMMFGILNNFL
jgi:hypothetical protein